MVNDAFTRSTRSFGTHRQFERKKPESTADQQIDQLLNEFDHNTHKELSVKRQSIDN